MIKSMTGFASLTRESEQAVLTVTVKSVNHRYLDAQLRLPPVLADLEHDLRALVQQKLTRGRVELGITVQLRQPPRVTLDVNRALMEALSTAAQDAREQGLVAASGGLTAGDLLRFPQVVTVREETTEDSVWHTVCDEVRRVTADALDSLDEMRRREGEFLDRDLSARSATLGVLVDQIVAEAKSGDAALQERLLARVAELEARVDVEASAIAQEVVRWAARSDIHEEVARLGGHLEHMGTLSAGAAACGRKLDFLVQEMNREVNTIGSKADGRGMAELVVAAKAEVERMREQVQNVE